MSKYPRAGTSVQPTGVSSAGLRVLGLVLAGVWSTAGGCKKDDVPGAPGPAMASPMPGSATPGPSSPGKFGTAVIRGNVHFAGKPPEMRTITTPDPFCAEQKAKEEDVVVGANGGLKNVLVHVSQGAAGTYDAPRTEALLDQRGCMYQPRVQAVLAGQTLQIRNSDQTLHNVHTYKGASTLFNQAQIPGMAPMTKTMGAGGQILKFRCDVHPWMTGYVGVLSNPFFAVTGDDGTFTIGRLPAGTYTLEAWHERSGVKTSAPITVADGQTATASFEFGTP
jgi:plastocyanin